MRKKITQQFEDMKQATRKPVTWDSIFRPMSGVRKKKAELLRLGRESGYIDELVEQNNLAKQKRLRMTYGRRATIKIFPDEDKNEDTGSSV